MTNFFNLANLDQVSKFVSNPTWDILAIFFFLAVGFFYGLSVGSKKLLSVLFALYVSILLFANFSYLDFFVEGRKLLEVFLFQAFIFLVFLVLLTILFNKTIFKKSTKTDKWWHVFVLSFLEVGLLMSAVFQLLPVKELFVFSPLIEKVFASSQSFLWWLVLPLIALFVIVRKRSSDN
jgi:hypothetical protein